MYHYVCACSIYFVNLILVPDSEVDRPSDVASGKVPGVKRAAIRKLQYSFRIIIIHSSKFKFKLKLKL